MRGLVVGIALLGGLLWAGAASGAAAERPQGTASPAEASRSATETPLPEYRPQAAGSESSAVWEGLRALLALGGVLLLVGVGARALRRWPGLLRPELRAEGLELVGRLALSGKEAVCLVRAGGEILVLGISPAGLTLLHRTPAGMSGGARVTGAKGAEAYGGDARPGSRFRQVAARLREVQSAWGTGAPRGQA
jgi:flagellar biogenesis protein FliO